MRRNLGIVGKIALENDDAAGAAADQEIGNNAESLETDLVEISDDVAEQAETEAATDEAVEVVEALEALVDSLAATAANGGLDKSGAAVLAISVGHMYSRVGFGVTRPAVAMESFGGTSSRVGATTLAMEDIKQKIVDIWKAIVAQVKKAIDWIKSHFMKVFGAAQKLETRAKSLKAKANDVKGVAKEKTFDSESLVKALHVKGTVPASFGSEMEKLEKMAKEVFGIATDWSNKSGESIADMLEQIESGSVALNDIVLPPSSVSGLSEVSSPEAEGFAAAAPGLKLMRSEELPGGMAIVGRVPGSELKGEAAAEAVGSVSIAVSPFKPKDTKGPAKATLTVLALPEVGKVCDAVEKLAGEVISYKAKLDKALKLQERIVKAGEKAGKAAATEENKEKATAMKTMQKFTSSSSRIINNPAASFSPYALKTGKSALDYVEQSLKQYA